MCSIGNFFREWGQHFWSYPSALLLAGMMKQNLEGQCQPVLEGQCPVPSGDSAPTYTRVKQEFYLGI